ncbi:MAG: cyclase family protein [Myxococcota bacterium]
MGHRRAADAAGRTRASTRAAALGGALAVVGVAAVLARAAGSEPLDLRSHTLVDLTHSYGADTLYWPTSPSHFELTSLHEGPTEAGYYYAANSFCTPEHGGTHLDAPHHFAGPRETVEKILLQRLIGPAVVIDISERAAGDPDALLTPDEVLAFEAKHGRIPERSIVLLRTGWSRRWPDAGRYLGDDTPGDASNLHFPSFGREAATLLITERRVATLGIDTASIDGGQSHDFPVHQIAAFANVPGLENLTGLEKLPPTGATILALPMKIEGGSGAPVRVVAILP